MDYIAASTQPGLREMTTDPDAGAMGDESRRAFADDARREFIRTVRRALSETLRQQKVYAEVRTAIRSLFSSVPFTRIETGPLLEDPLKDHSHGASRLFPGSSPVALFEPLDPSEMDASISGGVHPKLGVRWMKFYRVSWEPRSREIVHRLEYAVSTVGLGAAYRVVDGKATQAGVGMHLPLGRMASMTVSGSRALRGDERDGEREVMAELVWKF
jgi:hypothetical protein